MISTPAAAFAARPYRKGPRRGVASTRSQDERRTCLRRLRRRREGAGWAAFVVSPASVASRQRRRFGSAVGFHREMQLLLFVLELIEPIVNPALGEEFLMRALLAQPALVKYEDAIGMLNSAETMRDHERGSSGEQTVQGFAD